MSTLKTNIQVLLATALTLSGVACNEIPKAYRGSFQDRATGTQLQLKASKGLITFTDGRSMQVKATALTFQGLSEGKTGIFVRPNPTHSQMTEMFWVNPRISTRQENQGFVWFESEVLYTLMDNRSKEQISSFDIISCTNGTVMLDTTTQELEVGCPSGPMTFSMERTK